MPDPYLAVSGVSKHFGDTTALDNVSISVDRGEVACILGPSGCGKTTLLRIIAGLEAPDRGTVIVNGETLTGRGRIVPPERRRIGMVFQDWALFPHLTVADNVAFGLDAETDRVGEALELVGLTGFGDRYPDQLSGGQAQRVALARALAPRPRLILFDEPFSNLDSELRSQIRREVADLLDGLDMTAVFVTHDQEEAFVLGDQIVVMRNGRVAQTGTPDTVYGDPIDPWVASFVSEANVLPGLARAGAIDTGVGSLPTSSELEGACVAIVRPEHLTIEDGDAATVQSVDFHGHESSYRVMIGETRILVRAAAGPRFTAGDQVDLTYAGPDVPTFPNR